MFCYTYLWLPTNNPNTYSKTPHLYGGMSYTDGTTDSAYIGDASNSFIGYMRQIGMTYGSASVSIRNNNVFFHY